MGCSLLNSYRLIGSGGVTSFCEAQLDPLVTDTLPVEASFCAGAGVDSFLLASSRAAATSMLVFQSISFAVW